MPEEIPGDGDELSQPPSFFPLEGPDEAPSLLRGALIEVDIEGVFAVQQAGSINQFVLLSDGDRKLPIMIGSFEAKAITQALERVQPDRPLTHDLTKSILDRLGGKVERVNIDDLWNTTYYAKIVITTSSDSTEIDSRPSDAIALAIRFDAPIFVAEGILDSAEGF